MTRPVFEECPSCRAKPGAALLCHECLERRQLYSERDELLQALRVLWHGYVETPEDGDESWSARNTEACRRFVVRVLDRYEGAR